MKKKLQSAVYLIIAAICSVLTLVCAPFVWLDKLMTDKVLYGLRLKWWVKNKNKDL